MFNVVDPAINFIVCSKFSKDYLFSFLSSFGHRLITHVNLDMACLRYSKRALGAGSMNSDLDRAECRTVDIAKVN